MIFQSVFAMYIFDISFICFFSILLFFSVQYKEVLASLKLQLPFSVVLCGVFFLTLIYILDFLSISLLPVIIGKTRAINFMNDVLLNYSWILNLAGVGFLTFGLVNLFYRLLPELGVQLNKLEVTKQSLSEKNSELEKHIKRHNDELIKTNSALEAEVLEHREVQQALKQSEIRFRRFYDETPSFFFTIDDEHKILSMNNFGANQLGCCPEQLIGSPLESIVVNEDQNLQREFINQCFTNSVFSEIELRFTTVEGEVVWVRQTGRLVVGDDHQKSVLLACQDVSEARVLSDLLSFQSSHDHMTGLFNRRSLEQHLQLLLLNSQEDQTSHSLLYIDIDQLKVVNDTCGHNAGDGLIRQLVDVIQSAIRKNDYMARIGGDEFAIILEYCPLDEARLIAENIRHTVEEFTYVWESHNFKQSVSIGITDTSPEYVKVEDIMGAADAACYDAKQLGRNRVVLQAFSHNTLSTSHREMHWVSRLQKALGNDNFDLFFQPIISVSNPALPYIHYEILLRYQDEDGNLVLPGAFLPAAERFNISDQLDLWVIESVITFLNQHPKHVAQLECCSVNISATSLSSHRIEKSLEQLLLKAEFPTNKLCFEITETAAISNLNEAKVFMERIKTYGCSFALDDFGSGMASFGYLKNLPVDYIKIDGIFVRDMISDRIDSAMVSAINNIGHELKLTTIAEYVENDKIFEQLKKWGVDLAQGDAVGIAMPLTQLEDYYNSQEIIQQASNIA